MYRSTHDQIEIVAAEANGQHLVLAPVDGAIRTMARKCPHLGANLCGGAISRGAIVCPKHGAAFAVADGTPVAAAKILS